MRVPSEISVLRNICMSNSVEFMSDTQLDFNDRRVQENEEEREYSKINPALERKPSQFSFWGAKTAGTLTTVLVTHIDKLVLTSIALRKQEEK